MEIKFGQDLFLQDGSTGYADRPYRYQLSGEIGDAESFHDVNLTGRTCTRSDGEWIIEGRFAACEIYLRQIFRFAGSQIEEIIELTNQSARQVSLTDIKMGFAAAIDSRPDWRLCAIPFRIQLDGSRHDYTTQELMDGAFSNAVYTDKTRPEPELTEQGVLRSEAWAWGSQDRGIVIIKYNPVDIEYSVAFPAEADAGGEHQLCFGGAGFCLYGEPSAARTLPPGGSYKFGVTVYQPYCGGIAGAYEVYRHFLDQKGHIFPEDYNPPVNWNELYDIGWHHSNREDLARYYTREAILGEAEKARDCGCEMLYLDPGWEITEGTTLWDEERLGSPASLARELKEKYQLDLAFRTILRTYTDHWPQEYLVLHQPGTLPASVAFGSQAMWEPCANHKEFWRIKADRIINIARQGIKFIMIDEMDWRGPCCEPAHGHEIPTQAIDHVRAIYELSEEIRRQCPEVVTEVHDSVWPWHTCCYVPMYFRQGFGGKGAYDENWGFEFMWNCIEDLRSGKALSLYYYNLGCSIPLYLHITMAADNDACLFFWWAASTIRHLGIGGKTSNKTIEPEEGLPAYDKEKRFTAYQAQMRIYQQYKPYFSRGCFQGIAENIHLHTLPQTPGGVINVFNLEDQVQTLRFFIPSEKLGCGEALPVTGAEAAWQADGVNLTVELPPMSPGLVMINPR
ncbi:MAG TPA: hypothetical protein DD640_05915 [Clostridiales bacterium]|nr:hypothetical protein [Clostridiales bacterium]